MHQHGAWQPESGTVMKMRQLYTSIELLGKQLQQTKNQLGAFESSGLLDGELGKELEALMKFTETQKAKQEAKLGQLGRDTYKERKNWKRYRAFPA